MSSRKLARSIIVGAAAIAVAGGSYGIVSATSSSSSPAAASTSTAGGPASGGGGSNARSGPAAGGSSGTVSSLSTSGFTLTTSAGQKVTITEASATTYHVGTSPASANAIANGEPVLVLGTTENTAIAATQVIVHPAAPAAATAAQVIPFQRGTASTSKQAGQIPASYSQGSGTIVGGTAAGKATEAALAAYPGGIVDRVVRLSNGEYEVHNIGVNWPHHIFVNQDFKVIGAD
jgi:hypothetical protein